MRLRQPLLQAEVRSECLVCATDSAVPEAEKGRRKRARDGEGRTLPYIGTRECPSVGLLRCGQLSYHAGAELLEEAGALRAGQAGGRPPRPDALHAAAQQEGHAAARVGHAAALQHTHTTQC